MQKIILLLATLFIFSCSQSTEQYIQEEQARIQSNIDSVLKACGYTDYQVLIIPHTRYGRNVIEESDNSSEYQDLSSPPEGPPGVEGESYGSIPSQYFDSSRSVHYDTDNDQYMIFSHFSVLVVLKTDDPTKIEILLRNIALNPKRGDLVMIEKE